MTTETHAYQKKNFKTIKFYVIQMSIIEGIFIHIVNCSIWYIKCQLYWKRYVLFEMKWKENFQIIQYLKHFSYD